MLTIVISLNFLSYIIENYPVYLNIHDIFTNSSAHLRVNFAQRHFALTYRIGKKQPESSIVRPCKGLL